MAVSWLSDLLWKVHPRKFIARVPGIGPKLLLIEKCWKMVKAAEAARRAEDPEDFVARGR